MQDPSRPVTGYPAPNGCPPPQPGVAYPYHANQPNPYPYPYAYVQPNRASSSCAFIRSFILAMMVAFIMMGVTIFIVWLVLRPRFPEFQVESVSLTNFSASNSSSSITGKWNFRFSVTNPNKKMSISYDVVQCLLFYNPEFISETRIPPTIFYLI
ncbi:ndr1/hin1-like protein 10 [Fagus crenata]